MTSHRRKRIGGLLVAATMDVAACDRHELTVVDDNRPAIRTYERLGFAATDFSRVNSKGFREIETIRDPVHRTDPSGVVHS